MKPKSTATQIAEHFGWDVADVRDYRYQPSHWSQPVYAGLDGNSYWSAGRSAPHHRDGDDGITWVSVPSNYPGNNNLWKGV
jgi:hypothetical protein